MPDKPSIGAGSILKIGDGAQTEVFTAVAKIIAIDPITQTNPLVESTTLDSLAKEYIGGLSDGDEFGVRAQLLMDDATHGETAGMDKAFLSKQPVSFQLKFNGQSKGLTFKALCTQRGFGGVSAEGLMEHTWRMKISGAITVAAIT
ncbi:hypothetical protein [Methylobacterium dankookense]|uniref:Uncharacterized protein n=1 Tax=Methylobacterium dankookense TaxID=560405 RepID=A0A564G7N1_9HYPH|nr:hypothetical protein [Methylobacterium dankookense]GJD59621.1 hypothetical protein IFDJLNFL_5550 [Methylobacterium dankookense]VUF15938.1 hypothetical protein MTDSW087_05687 [Methylobacterium dankookense]